jgi:antitoxin (DNA-binding transcriptional repressor) of toxin-antitoxin stability system
MHTVSLFDAKTHLSRIVEDLLTGREDRVIISRRGKPVACVTPLKTVDTTKRSGIARGQFEVPDDIDAKNPEVAVLFGVGDAPTT